MSAAPPRRPSKGQREQRMRPNLKPPAGRLRERKARLEEWIDPTRFDRVQSLALDRVIAALERRP
jgi:hypothetical protein